jgi:formylglycine-generating enzyme required for sulfatase activity
VSDIFISYANADRARVQPLVAALRQRGWSVWWDRTIPPGKTWDQVIEAALNDARCVIVLWSRDSVHSDWVRTEADEAKQRGILVPALLDQVPIPLAFRRIQAANLVGWRGALPYAGFEELAGAVTGILGAAEQRREDEGGALRTRTNPKDGLTYVWIPPGTFTMGCSAGDGECNDSEKPAHQVTITRGFWIGQTPVTQEAYERVTGTNPSRFRGARLPGEGVTWEEARAYCEAVGMRLPTEAEWEYAARGGDAAARYGPVDVVAWHRGNSDAKTHEVGQKQANGFGLYDMLGNVWEWVADWYERYHAGPVSDPRGPLSGTSRVLRGGSWYDDPRLARASYRLRIGPENRFHYIGLRCAGD